MKKNVYNSAVDKINFDEQLENKIMDYIKENSVKGESKVKNYSKNKKRISVAAAACAVCLLSGATYASVMNFREVLHSNHGLSAETKTQDESIANDLGKGDKFTDTKEQREQMEKFDLGYEVVSEDKGNSNVKWKQKTILKDASPSYKSDDNKNWEVDTEAPVSMISKYSYEDYNTALEDSSMPSIMDNLLSKVKLSKEVTVDEHYTDVSSDITRKVVTGEFNYKTGKVNVQVSKDTNNNGVSVITGINEATNEREYKSQDGTIYKLSDNNNDDILKTTTLISKGYYNVIIQFENLSDSDIHTILDNIDLSTL